MKLLIIHLSDSHISTPANALHKAEIHNMITALGDLNTYSNILVAFTGDVTRQGTEDQFTSAQAVFTTIVDKLKESYKGQLDLFVIPGNHDILFRNDNDKERASAVVGFKSIHELEELRHLQLSQMSEYETWATQYDCNYNGKQIVSESFSMHDTCKPSRIQITLINSAPISTFKSPSDKGYHYLPADEIEKICCKDDNALHIVMSHHSPEWFTESIKKPLFDAICSFSDILLVGHEHIEGLHETIDREGRQLITSEGGELKFETNQPSTFSTIQVDMSDYPYHITQTTFEQDKSSHHFKAINAENEITLYPKRGALAPRSLFITNVKSNEDTSIIQAPILDYFVFPVLTCSTDLETGRSSQINNYKSFFSQIVDADRICIRGKVSSGKTTLLKALYLKSFEQGYVPLLLTPDYACSSVSRMLNNLISEQYGDSELISRRFEEVPRGRKILFIDDFELLKKKRDSAYLDTLLNHVGKVIYTAPETPIPETIEDASDTVKHQIGLEGTITKFSINDFRKSKRDALVRKICEVELAPDPIVDRLIQVIDQVTASHHSTFNANPEFIIHYAKYLLDHQDSMSANDVLPMALLYESNLHSVIEKTLKQKSNGIQERFAQKVLVILSEIAYTMHIDQQPLISTEDIAQIVRQYAVDHAINLEFTQILNAGLESKILMFDSAGKIRFTSINYLAYFISAKIARKMSKDQLGDDLNFLLDNIYMDINERILLFLAYLRDNNELPLELCERLENMLGSFEKVDFSPQALSFLSVDVKFKIGCNDAESIKERNQFADEVETQLADQDEFNYSDIYDQNKIDEETSTMTMIKALKYLEMLGRSYVAQFVYSDATTKELIREALFDGSSKILGATLNRLSSSFDPLVDNMVDAINSGSTKETVERSVVERYIAAYIYIFCVVLLDCVAYCCSESDTVDYLCAYSDSGTNASILKLCMRENALDSEYFIDHLCVDATSSSNIVEKNLIMIIANKHIANHTTIDRRNIDRISQTVFGNMQAKKKLIVEKMKRQEDKKHSDTNNM